MPVSFLLASGAGAGCSYTMPRPARDLTEFESRLEGLRLDYGIPGMSAALVLGDSVWSRGFGLADIEKGDLATPETVYHLCSLTKPFAAVVLLQLVEEGKLDLDAPAARFGIDLESEGVIRVRHLLTHTSQGVPGTEFHYSGNRFGKLDRVVEGAGRRTFAEEVAGRILDPLGLADTAPNPNDPESSRKAGRDPAVFAARLARGYASDGKTPVEYPKHFVTAAGLVSTAGNMAKFSRALDDGRLLREETREMAFSPALDPDGRPLPYGLGWFVQDRNGVRMLWHYGWWVGSSSLIIKVPERRLTFVLLANSDMLSRKFDLGQDEDVLRSPFAREFVAAFVDAAASASVPPALPTPSPASGTLDNRAGLDGHCFEGCDQRPSIPSFSRNTPTRSPARTGASMRTGSRARRFATSCSRSSSTSARCCSWTTSRGTRGILPWSRS
jgi:CubicO group peptidase (beta-lactamase class C family)